jgi:hypothetical protein
VIGAYRKIALVEVTTDDAGNSRVVDSFQISPSFGVVWYQTVDLGYPGFRTASQDNPQADGTYNQTEFMSDRSISIGLTIRNNAFGSLPTDFGWDSSIGWNSAAWWVRYLSAWVTAARRIHLFFEDDLGRQVWAPLVGASATSAVSRDSAFNRDMLISFTDPTGKLYSFHEGDGGGATRDGRLLRSIRQSTIGVPGLDVTAVPFPITFPADPPPTIIDYDGTVPNGVLLRIHTGASVMTHPKVTFTAPDGSQTSVEVDEGLDIAANTTVEIDTNAKSIKSYADSDPSVVSDLDGYKAGPLTWPVLKPGYVLTGPRGRNTIDFDIDSGDTNAALEVIYSEAHLL